jgi:iron complex outermembrane receptor protein
MIMLCMTAHARVLLGAASLGVFMAASFASPSSALARTVRNDDVNLSAMPLGDALRAIAAQTGETINFDPDAVRGIMSRPVHGAETPGMRSRRR